jgi:hypothetical protein
MGGEHVAERTLAVFRSSDVTGNATRTLDCSGMFWNVS